MGLNSNFLPRKALEELGFADLGEDVLIHSTAVIVNCERISIGSRVRIDPFVIISTRGIVEFGNNVHLGGHSLLAGRASVHFGDFVNISHYVGIFTTNENISGRTLSHPTLGDGHDTARTASIVFGRHSAVGAGSMLFPGARLDEGAGLGAMSRTSRPLKAWTIYAGIPARRMGERSRDILQLEKDYLASLPRPVSD